MRVKSDIAGSQLTGDTFYFTNEEGPSDLDSKKCIAENDAN